MMIEHTIHVQDQHLHYTLEEKPIKNVNLRIRPDGSVYVSAPFGTSRTLIDDFVASKSKQILAIQQAHICRWRSHPFAWPQRNAARCAGHARRGSMAG